MILGMCLLVLIALCVGAIVAHRIWRKSPKTPEVNNDIELGVVPQRAAPAPINPRLVFCEECREYISPPSSAYLITSFEDAKEDLAVDGMEHTDSSRK